MRDKIYLFIWLYCLLMLFAPDAVAGNTVLLKKGSPVFSEPGNFDSLTGIISDNIYIPALTQTDDRVIRHNMYPYGWFPLMFYTTFYQLPGTVKTPLWVSPDLILMGKQQILPRKTRNPKFLNIAIFWQGILLILLLIALKKKIVTNCFSEFDSHPLKNTLFLMGFLILLRFILLAVFLYLGGRIMVYPTDEADYFRIGHDIINGTFSGPWKYTIGQGIIYIPFIIFSGAESYYDIVNEVTVFNAMILAPAILVLSFFIVKKISGSVQIGFSTAFFLAIIPFFYYPYETSFKAIVHLPLSSSIYDYYTFYYMMIATGWNGMSDVPAYFLLLLSIMLCLYFPDRILTVFFVSAIFGFTCLVRINSIFYAPLLGWLFWLAMKNRFVLKPKLLWLTLCGSVGIFLLCFSPQFMINKMQFGNFMTFPYVLHPHHAADGFTVSDFIKHARYLVDCNCLYVYPGVAAMLMMKSFNRIILALWIIPVFLFFCGYPVVTAGLIRFILPVYAALIAAVIIFLKERGFLKGKKQAAFYAILLLTVFSVVPVSPFKPEFQFNLGSAPNGVFIVKIITFLLPVVSLGMMWFLLKENKRDLFKVIIFLLIYFSGSYLLIIGLMLLILGKSLFEAGKSIYISFTREAHPEIKDV